MFGMMHAMKFAASDLATAAGGTMVGADVTVDGAHYDSRSVTPGQLFVAVAAERDGHDFVTAAVAAGASAVLVSRPVDTPDGVARIEVGDTVEGLNACGSAARDRLGDRVVGITGSVGKTSVKDMAASVVARRFRTTASPKSFNNHLGVPVTLLNAPDDTEVAVLELGMNNPGEIAARCEVARPTIGVVTAIGEAHAGRVGGIEGVARAKGELIEALPPTGTAILNADQPAVMALAARTSAASLTFGAGAGDVRATAITLDDRARPRFWLRSPWGDIDVALGVSGMHMAVNAAAAAAVGLHLGVELVEVAAGLEEATLSASRMAVHTTRLGALVLDDAYNANPTSMRAALDALAALPARRRIAVLGVMAELDEPERHHREIADYAASLGVELRAVGTDAYGVTSLADIDAAAASLARLGAGDAVLVKGSLVAGLQALAARLIV